MLSAPVRREINNDLGDARERSLKTYAQHSLYGGQQAVQKSVFERQYEPAAADTGSPAVNTNKDYSNSQIARKLFGDEYDASYELDSKATYDKSPDYANPDLMPSRTTMYSSGLQSYRREGYAPEKVVPQSKTKSETRTKILVASYIAVVLALVLIITLASVSVATLFSDVAALQIEFDAQASEVVKLNDEVDYASSPENIAQRAQFELDMSTPSGSSVNTYNQPVTKDAPSYTVDGNWFDSFTKWISSIFS